MLISEVSVAMAGGFIASASTTVVMGAGGTMGVGVVPASTAGGTGVTGAGISGTGSGRPSVGGTKQAVQQRDRSRKRRMPTQVPVTGGTFTKR
jgi:hypothetical protein